MEICLGMICVAVPVLFVLGWVVIREFNRAMVVLADENWWVSS